MLVADSPLWIEHRIFTLLSSASSQPHGKGEVGGRSLELITLRP